MSYDRTVAIVRTAIPRMSELKIPITPSNYAVWFAYLGETNQALRSEMDALLQQGSEISDDQMQSLYARFLDASTEEVATAKSSLSQLVNSLMSHIGDADGLYNALSGELSDVARDLQGNVNSADLGALIDRAVKATNTALDRGAEMKKKFSDLAVEMQQVRSELVRSQEEARADALTGLFNRLAFQEQLDELARTGANDTHAPSLLVIDIDFFKKVNDTYGHLAGDHVLREVAAAIKDSVRGRDIVARHGGEEFAVLLRDTPRSGCMAVAENIRLHIASRAVMLPPDLGFKEPVEVTVSLGGAWYRESETTEALVDRADRALYQAKEGGRNRVVWEGR